MILFITVIVYYVIQPSRNRVKCKFCLENELKNINSLSPGSVSDLNDDQVPTYLPNSPET